MHSATAAPGRVGVKGPALHFSLVMMEGGRGTSSFSIGRIDWKSVLQSNC